MNFSHPNFELQVINSRYDHLKALNMQSDTIPARRFTPLRNIRARISARRNRR